MGGGASYAKRIWLKLELADVIIQRFLPSYYVAERPTPHDIILAKDCWIMIQNGSSVHYQESVLDPGSVTSLYPRCFDCFCDLMFDSLTSISVTTRNKFGETVLIESWVVHFFQTLLNEIEEPFIFSKKIENFYRFYSQKIGLNVRDLGLIGEMSFFAFGKVLRDDYTFETHMAWIKIYSWMLEILIPVAIAQDFNGNDEDIVRQSVYSDWNRCVEDVSTRIKPEKRSLRNLFRNVSNEIYPILESFSSSSRFEST